MSNLDPLIAWLTAVLNEDATIAEAALWNLDDPDRNGQDRSDGVWTVPCPHGQENSKPPSHYDRCCEVDGDTIRIYDEGGHTRAHALHIARHDPQSVLARVEAERALVALHTAALARKRATWLDYCAWVDGDPTERAAGGIPDGPHESAVPGLEIAVRALAWGYRHREGYRSEWAPEGVRADA